LKDRLERKDDEIKIANRHMEQVKSELGFVEKELNRYKTIALGTTEKNTYYTQMTNEDLKFRAVNLSGKLREFIRTSQEKLREVTSQQQKSFINASTEEEKWKVWDKYTTISGNVFANFMDEYNKKYKAEAIIIHNELLSRLPEEAIQERKKKFG